MNQATIQPTTSNPQSVLSDIQTGWQFFLTSIKDCIKKPSLTVAMMVLDSFFLISLGILSTTFMPRFIDTLFSLASTIVPASTISTQTTEGALMQASIQGHILQAALLFLLLSLGALVAFCALCGLAWSLARSIAGKQPPWIMDILTFTRTTLLLFPFYLLYETLAFLRDFRELSLERTPGLILWNPSLLVPILGLLVLYVASITYALLQPGNATSTVKAGIRMAFANVHHVLPRIFPLLGLTAVIELASRFLLDRGTTAAIAGLLLVLGLFSIGRVFLLITLEGIEHE